MDHAYAPLCLFISVRSANLPASFGDFRRPLGAVVPYSHGDGQGGIRTLDTLAGIPVFETGGFNRSPTCPERLVIGQRVSGIRRTAVNRRPLTQATVDQP